MQKYGYHAKGVTVTRTTVREYLARQRERYHRLTRRDRGRLLTEIVAVTGYHRKAVLPPAMARRPSTPRPLGRPRRYGADMARAAQVLWEATGQISAKRLRPFVPALGSPPRGARRADGGRRAAPRQ